jgi:hypothetical protein
VPFRALLAELVDRTPGARGAIFCDYEGESVELALAEPQPAGFEPLSIYDMKICGAQLAAVWIQLDERSRQQKAGRLLELQLGARQGTLHCCSVKDGYYLTLLTAPGPASGRATRALRKIAEQFAQEM